MKMNFKSLLPVFSLICILGSCNKHEDKAVLQDGTAPVLVASANSIVLTSANAADTVQTLSWSASSYGYQAAVTYTLQFAKAGTNFASVEEISQTTIIKKFTVAALNQIAVKLGLAFNTAAQIEVRVKSSINNVITPSTSNVVAITVTPYQVIVDYPSLYVPGDYLSATWTPDQSPKISSKTNNGTYEGYLYFPNTSNNFKFTNSPDWNHTNYGSGGTGVLSTSGSSGNLTVTGLGYYRVIANTTALTWSSTKVTYGIIGNAPVASNNWGVDVPMTYNASTQVWTVTTNMVAGALKFRANSDWSDPMNNFGDDAPADGVPDYNSSTNIAINSAGNYTITLDLHIPGNYSYTVRKN